jgi:hypothetical protein
MTTLNYAKGVLQVLLLTAAVSKLITAGSQSPALDQADPIMLYLSTRQVMLLVAVLELCCLTVMWARRSLAIDSLILAFFAISFTAYRVAFAIGGYEISCNCFGKIWEALGLGTREILMVNYITYGTFMAAYLLFLWQIKRTVRPAFAPISEPAVGMRIPAQEG